MLAIDGAAGVSVDSVVEVVNITVEALFDYLTPSIGLLFWIVCLVVVANCLATAAIWLDCASIIRFYSCGSPVQNGLQN